jgi:cysteine desulfurase
MNSNPIIYCDYAATTPMLPEVRAIMAEADKVYYGNPSSIHKPGQAARVALERARKTIANSLDARPDEIILTSGGTEANNLALFGLLASGDHVIASSIEHPSILQPLEKLLTQGIQITNVDAETTGRIAVEQVAEAIRPETRLICIMALNNETGVLNDCAAIGAIALKHNILFHTDAVQAFGKIPIQPESDGIHFLSASAHKIGGPKGIGLLYARKGIPFAALHLGGSQERSHRAGTENLSAALGFAKAVEVAQSHQSETIRKLKEYRAYFLDELSRAGIQYEVNGVNCYPGIINIRFPGILGQSLMIGLDMEDIAISYGSSCASGTAKDSHVLLSMGLNKKEASESVRFSFGGRTTKEEVRTVARAVVNILGQRDLDAHTSAPLDRDISPNA